MPSALDSIDPDSLRGKILLLVLDKVILGALIALALVAYDRWKIADQRTYDDQVTFAFQRANYVKELVPTVADPKQDLLVRSQSLIALIETRSIGDRSAMYFTQQLLDAGVLRVGYPQLLIWNQESPLLDALRARMPSGLQPLFEQYLSSHYPGDVKTTDPLARQTSDEFWANLFSHAIDDHSDQELSFVSDDEFLRGTLPVMDELFDRVPGATRQILAKRWFTRSKGVRLIAALRGVDDVGISQHRDALQYLVGLITPTQAMPSRPQGELASTIINLLQQKHWKSKSIATACVKVLLSGEEVSSVGNRNLACIGYLDWYADTDRDPANHFDDGDDVGDGGNGWIELQSAAASRIPRYWTGQARVDAATRTQKPYLVSDSSVAMLVRVLLDKIENGHSPEPAIRQILNTVLLPKDDPRTSLFSEITRARWRILANSYH